MGKSKISIIVAREFTTRVKKKSFILTTLLTPLLFGALMVVPTLIAMYSSEDDTKTILVVDNSGMVYDKLENNNNLSYQLADGKDVDELKKNFKDLDAYALMVVSNLNENKDVNLTIYSEKQLNIEAQNGIKRSVSGIISDNKLADYDIPNLDQIMDNIKANVDINTFVLGEDGKEKVSKVEIYMGIGYIASFMIYMFIFMFGSMVMRSVIEEKTTRIIEVIVSSVKPFQLMMGKILGVASVALTQFLIWIVLTISIASGVTYAMGDKVLKENVTSQTKVIEEVAYSAGASDQAIAQITSSTQQVQPELDGIAGYIEAFKSLNYVSIILCFIIYFTLGYLLYSSMFAAVGAAVDNEADTQQLIMPVTIPLIIGLFIMIHTFQNPDSSLSFWGSIIPFTSPMVMMARIAYGVPTWELALSISLLIITFILMAYLSGKVYRVGILMYGKKPSWKDLIKWLKY